MTPQLPDNVREHLRTRLALTKCTHDVDVNLGPPCSWCLLDAIDPIVAGLIAEAHQAGVRQSLGELRLFGAMLEMAEAESRRYRDAWCSARRRAAMRAPGETLRAAARALIGPNLQLQRIGTIRDWLNDRARRIEAGEIRAH